MGVKQTEILIFTAPDSGLQLKVKRVAGGLIDDLRRALLLKLPEPKVPINRVNYGTEEDPHWEEEENPADPVYLTAVEAWKRTFNQRLAEDSQRMMLRMGVLPYLDWNEEKQAAVDELRRVMREEFNTEIDGSDQEVYINRIVLITPEDAQDLAMFLVRRQQPTEAAIAESVRKF